MIARIDSGTAVREHLQNYSGLLRRGIRAWLGGNVLIADQYWTCARYVRHALAREHGVQLPGDTITSGIMLSTGLFAHIRRRSK